MLTLTLERIQDNSDPRSWLNNWKYAVDILDDILSLPLPAMRIRLMDDPKILCIVDGFLDLCLKNWKKEDILNEYVDKNIQLDCGKEFRDIVVDIYTKVLMLFMRLAINNEELVEKQDHQLKYKENNLFFTARLLRALAIFKLSNLSAAKSFVSKAFETKQLKNDDILTYMESMEKKMDAYSGDTRDLTLLGFNENESEAYLESFLVDFEGLTVVLSVMFTSNSSQKISRQFLKSLARFVQHLEEYHAVDKIINISPLLQETFRTLSMLVDNLVVSAYDLFHTLIGIIDVPDEIYSVIASCLQYERFIFYYSIIYSFEEVIVQCDQQQKNFLNDAFVRIKCSHTKRILEQLRRRGLLVELGSSPDLEVQKIINYLVELLPHLSPQFVHLCLRHFGYQSEQTTNALLNIVELPLDMQALMSVDLKSEKPMPNVNISSLFYDSIDVDGAAFSRTKFSTEENSLISMKPPQAAFDLKQTPGSTKTASQERLKDVKNDLKVEFSVDTFLQKEKIRMQMKSKRKSFETFDVPESEKIALRPSYERYRYVEAISSDLYDDEYDDTYDGYQNYDLDFRDLRDDDVAVIKNKTESNTNLMRIEEKNGNAEDIGEEMAPIGGVKMKAHSKSKCDISSDKAIGQLAGNKVDDGSSGNSNEIRRVNRTNKLRYTGKRGK